MVEPSSPGIVQIFDQRAVRSHRNRAVFRFSEYDFLFREIASRLTDRLADLNRTFDCAIDLGAHGGILRDTLSDSDKVTRIVEADLAVPLLAPHRDTVVVDQELLPFGTHSADLVLSNLTLHWINDLPGVLAQIRRILRPDGLFLAAMFGGETLSELRHALLAVETAVKGGATPRVSPFADLADAAALLQRAGFALPVADLDTITVTYPDAFTLMRELRGMGESNATSERQKSFTPRRLLFDMAAHYSEIYADSDGRLPATFQILYLAGWAPHESQQKPARPGSAETRLADALGSSEQPAGEKTRPDIER